MSLTTDPTDPRLTRGVDTEPKPQAEVYLVLSPEEIAKGFVRPFRDSYKHLGPPDAEGTGCGTVTTMGTQLASTYAREPKFYGSTYCVHCMKHLPVSEFRWVLDGAVVGS